MSGGKATNDQAVQFQQQQAAEAQQKEALRQQHLNQGMDAINKIFNGSPVYTTTKSPFDWSSFNATPTTVDPVTGLYGPSGVPAGYTAVQLPAKGGGAGGGTAQTSITAGGQSYALPQGFTKDPQTGALVPPSDTSSNMAGKTINAYGQSYTFPSAYTTGTGENLSLVTQPGGGAGNTVWGLQDASGKQYYPGDPFDVSTTTQTGMAGGFGEDFYNKYRQNYLDLYMPDEARQYQEANRDLAYNLANAGTTRSSMAADKQGEIAYNDQLQKAKIVSDASGAEQDLRTQVEGEKQKAINQLYSTEDPTLAADLAQSSANAINLKTPLFTPGAQLFGPALTAVASGIASYASPFTTPSPYSAYPGTPGTMPGSVASAATSSGRAYS
jgi:hypothetical protein